MATRDKKLPIALRILAGVFVAIFGWVAGAAVGVALHLLSPPITVDTLPARPAKSAVYFVKPTPAAGQGRQTRDRTQRVLRGESGVWRFSFAEVNAWLSASQPQRKVKEGFSGIATGPIALRADGGLLTFSSEFTFVSNFGNLPLIAQVDGRFRPGATGLEFRPSAIRINSLQIPALGGWQAAVFDWLVSTVDVRPLPGDVWRKVDVLSADSDGVTLSLQ